MLIPNKEAVIEQVLKLKQKRRTGRMGHLKNTPFVIAIAGVSGGGKTAVTTYLTQELPHAKALCFDDYDFDRSIDIINWLDSGADYNQWDLTPLINDLKSLCNESLHYIILDYPFAYKHFNMSRFIDIAVFIDTPLDIALARRMRRDFKSSSGESVLADMENYIAQGRKGFVEMLNTVRPNSDVVIDGTRTVSEIADRILDQLE